MATVTSNASCSPSSISVSGKTTSTGTISWTLPSVPSGSVIQSCVLSGKVSSYTSDNKGAYCYVNNQSVDSGANFSIDLGTNNTTTSVTVSLEGRHKQSNTSVSFSNLVYTVTYTEYVAPTIYTVTFVDWNGTVLKTQEVEQGSSATPPSNPTRERYKFYQWDKDYTNITSDTQIKALYHVNALAIGNMKFDNIYLGNSKITSVYLGDMLLYERESH